MTREELLRIVRANKKHASDPHMAEMGFDPFMAYVYSGIERKILTEMSSRRTPEQMAV
jgi:hypothetical protein